MYFRGNYLLVLIHISQHLAHFVLLINTYPLSFLIRHRYPSTIDRHNEGGHTRISQAGKTLTPKDRPNNVYQYARPHTILPLRSIIIGPRT
jgi:hypothetical protein